MIPITEIINAAARTVYLNPGDITGKSKAGYIVSARRAVAHIAREHGYSYHAIGAALNRDHSTIVYGEDVSETKLATSAGFRTLVQHVKANIRKVENVA